MIKIKNKSKEYFFEYPNFKDIKELINYTVNKFPNNKAFIIKEKISKEEVKYHDITFKEFLEDINNLGTALYDLGLNEKKVAIISKNRYEWFLGFLATLMGNMIVVPLDKGLTAIEIENCVSKVNPEAIIFDNEYKNVIDEIKEKNQCIESYICMDQNSDYLTINELKEKGKALRDAGNKEYENAEIDADKTSELCFTSGTSNNSKIVELSHRNIASDISALHATEDFRETDVNLAFLPFHHTFGSTGLLLILSYGAASAFPDGLRYIAQNLKEYGISVFIGVPALIETMYKKVLKEIRDQGKEKTIQIARKVTNLLPKTKRKIFKPIIDALGGKLRVIISGASGLDPEVWLAFNEMGIKILQGYGLTEASPVVAAENYKYGRKGSIGFPLKGISVKIFDKNELGIGELAVKGDNVMKGYYNNEEATAESFRDGWLLTGDLAYIDKDGYIFITGRKKNVIVLKNGKNIYPEEIETLINKIELVKESMVFGMPKEDDLMVSVKVQYDEEYAKKNYPNLTEEELKNVIWEKIKEINKTMPTYKYVKNILITKEEFIKTTTAKIKRYEEMKKILYA